MQNLPRIGLLSVLALLGCSDGHDAPSVAINHLARTGGGAVALSRDERIAVVANRSAGIVSVVALAPEKGPGTGMITGKIEFDTGADSEPWAAIVAADDDTAYVLFRQPQRVGKLTSLHGTPAFTASVSVGSEPSAIALSPSGKKLFVSNWGEGTISVISTDDFVQEVKIDLNQVLVDTGVLGTVQARAALAHPRALAVTDDGDEDDTDETLYATEFFSQPILNVPELADLSQIDRNRQGFVYPIRVKTGQPRGPAIPIAPVQNTGFVDGNKRVTDCFPNQLYAAAVNAGMLYVTSICTSPRGPLGATKALDPELVDNNFKTLLHSAVFVIDTASDRELPLQGRLLTQILDGYFQKGEEVAGERMPLIPNDIAFGESSSGISKAYVSALGSDAVYPLEYDASGTLRAMGSAGARFIDLEQVHGLPIGVAASRRSNPAFVLAVSDVAQVLSLIDPKERTVSSVPVDAKRARDFKNSPENLGHGFFGTGRDIWSLKGQAWSSCESCHPGGLSDGVTWFFSRGPRRTLSTASTYDKLPNLEERTRRLMLWGANIDEVHDVDAIARSVSGGVGAVHWFYASGDDSNSDCRLVFDGTQPQALSLAPCLAWKASTDLANGLNGSLSALDTGKGCNPSDAVCNKNALPDWSMIDRFIRAERVPRAPAPFSAAEADQQASDIEGGRRLFVAGQCAGCHGGSGWTVSKLFYEPGAEANGALPSAKPSAGGLRLGTLRDRTYTVPPQFLDLNPPARDGKGSATFRTSAPSGGSESELIEYAYTAASQNDDQLRCALRDVGTFPSQAAGFENLGVSPRSAASVFEFRGDMVTLAQGANGFNVPSLFGLSVGAPYFHAGNARTLEEVFDSPTFARHHQALSGDFLSDPSLRERQIARLVAFLLSIDEQTATEQSLVPDFCRP